MPYVPVDHSATLPKVHEGARDPLSGSPPRRAPYFLAALFLFWLLAYGLSIFHPALLDDADSVHAEAAREIVLRHDWVTLYADGVRYLEKAPLLYWGMAASLKTFGVHDWSARLPLMLGILALLFGTYWVGKRVYGNGQGS